VPIRLLAPCLAAVWALASAAPAAAAPLRVAILPLAVHSAQPDTNYLSAGLADMLAARLEMSGAVQVVRVESNARHTELGPALEVGRAASADYVLFGSFTHFGQGASLDLRCARVAAADGEGEGEALRRVFVQSGTLAEIIPRLDDLTTRLEQFLLGGAPAPGNGAGVASGPASESPRLRALERRVETLEREVERLRTAGGEGAAGPAAGAGSNGGSVR